ncbi:Eukaryotic peptide chain release factor subunit 1 [Nymphon striatum]|nr:Eukaryotic peptide chain release factor subunit 1 [Nymphon striatum]
MASTGYNFEESSADRNVEIWKIKKLIKSLEAARGNGTSMISLIIPPKDQISRVSKMLADEFGTASNIKSRVNRLSVLGAITSVQHRLKLYTKVPPNGLVIYCGTIVTDEGKEKKVNIDFEPFKPINTSLYLCDNKFHTEALSALLADDNKFGFIVMDGNGALFGTLQGNTRDVLHKFTVDLPKKHGRGGQSALRFARLRMEKRHNYVRKVAEVATQLYITNDKPNVAGLILAGSADFKTELRVNLICLTRYPLIYMILQYLTFPDLTGRACVLIFIITIKSPLLCVLKFRRDGTPCSKCLRINTGKEGPEFFFFSNLDY